MASSSSAKPKHPWLTNSPPNPTHFTVLLRKGGIEVGFVGGGVGSLVVEDRVWSFECTVAQNGSRYSWCTHTSTAYHMRHFSASISCLARFPWVLLTEDPGGGLEEGISGLYNQSECSCPLQYLCQTVGDCGDTICKLSARLPTRAGLNMTSWALFNHRMTSLSWRSLSELVSVTSTQKSSITPISITSAPPIYISLFQIPSTTIPLLTSHLNQHGSGNYLSKKKYFCKKCKRCQTLLAF